MKNEYKNQQHVASYYAASANQSIEYPRLQGSHRVDICIVGAGFTGIATALTLAERGYKVAVVEANRIAWGASGRNGGQMIRGISGESKILSKFGPGYQDLLWQLRWRGHEIIHERVEKYSIQCALKSGYMDVASKHRQVTALEEEVALMEKYRFPYDYRLLDAAETAAAIGTDAYVGSLLNFRDGHLHPLNLCAGEARAAAALGVQIFEQSPVSKIVHGPKPRVETAEGQVEADSVVLAGHIWHQLEQQKLSGTTFQAGSFIIATEPLSEEVRQQINPQDVAICEMNNIIDYYRLSADGRMLYGGRCNYSGRVPASIQAVIAPRMHKIYPQLKNVRIDYEWGCSIGIVVRRIPMVGRIDDNIYYVQGYSGHGVNCTHIMGEVIADAIGGTLEKFDLFAKMPQVRVPFGNYAGNQIIALGMLYYRLKDLL
ncbi:MAG TPA: FAD-binding oxidoreductase [Xanthomonadales bacterium]|nr:FAD-binding oxidoreductase [Xanthomonadales bacterium]